MVDLSIAMLVYQRVATMPFFPHGAGILIYSLGDFVRANFGNYSSSMEYMVVISH